MPKHKTEEEKYCTNTPHQFLKAGRNTSFFVTLPTASSLWSVSLLYFIFLKDQPLFFFVAHSNTSLPLLRPNREGTQTFANWTCHPAPYHHPPTRIWLPAAIPSQGVPCPLCAISSFDSPWLRCEECASAPPLSPKAPGGWGGLPGRAVRHCSWRRGSTGCRSPATAASSAPAKCQPQSPTSLQGQNTQLRISFLCDTKRQYS